MIEFKNVTKSFGTGETAVRAVDDLSFELPAGKFWAIMGPSGSGKSTVLHLSAALTSPDNGAVIVDGADMATLDPEAAAEMRLKRIGYIFQSFNLLPFLSAADNVGMPLILAGATPKDVAERVDTALNQVGLVARSKHLPGQLSGGEQQRVAIARALAIDPAVILADEPTGSLDRANGRAIMDLLSELSEDSGLTVLMVTHDPVFAARAERILRLVDGRLDQDIPIGGDYTFDDETERAFASPRRR